MYVYISYKKYTINANANRIADNFVHKKIKRRCRIAWCLQPRWRNLSRLRTCPKVKMAAETRRVDSRSDAGVAGNSTSYTHADYVGHKPSALFVATVTCAVELPRTFSR